MNTENILAIEENSNNRINLVRDRLFWQAWNKSAFLFTTHITKYQVHKRFVEKYKKDVAWLGFPSVALASIQEIAKSKGFEFEQKSDNHIVIDNVPNMTGYEEWWASIVKKKPKPAQPNFKISETNKDIVLPAYKTAYDLCLHIHRATLKMSREFRYELGARIRNYATDIAENLHLAANKKQVKIDADVIHRLRVDIRILKDLEQISEKQWEFLNQQIENLLNLAMAESCNTKSRIAGESIKKQSSGTLSPVEMQESKQNNCGVFSNETTP